jgi:hypothetical protein
MQYTYAWLLFPFYVNISYLLLIDPWQLFAFGTLELDDALSACS